VVLKIFMLLSLLLALCCLDPALAESPLPDGQGKTILHNKCQSCHEMDISIGKRYTRVGWKKVTGEMIDYGLDISEKELKVLVDYLAAHRGPTPSK
jgi:hypothetical protein